MMPPPDVSVHTAHIALTPAATARYWANYLMCNEKQLRQAVAAVGPGVAPVRQYLQRYS